MTLRPWGASSRARRGLVLGICAWAGACTRGPSDAEALAAIRAGVLATEPAIEGTPVVEEVWQDGPPWFSCAEVLAKLRAPGDSAVIRDPLANWRPLLLSEWATVRDTSSGAVTDPGWCAVKLAADSMRRREGWIPFSGPPFPTGAPRRGWRVTVGTRAIVLRRSAELARRDSAQASYAIVVAPNANGVALRSDRDSLRFRGALRRVRGEWQLASTTPAPGDTAR